MDAFDEFMNAGGGGGEDSGTLGAVGNAALAGLDSVADYIFGADDDNTVFGLGDSGGAMVPGGDYGAELAGLADPASQSAAMQLVSAIMGSGVVGQVARTMLDRLPGVIFDAREPSYNGSPLTTAMLSILFRKLSKNEQEAIVERLAGGQTPLTDNNKTRGVFRVLYVYDALRALNEHDAAEAIFYGQK